MNVILRNQKRMMWATGMNFSASKHKKRYEQTTALPFWKNDSNTQPVTSLHTTARPPSISYVFSPETRGLSTSNSLTRASPQLGPNALTSLQGAGSWGGASKHRTCTGIRRLWTICTVAPWHNSSVHCDTSVTKCPGWHIASPLRSAVDAQIRLRRRLATQEISPCAAQSTHRSDFGDDWPRRRFPLAQHSRRTDPTPATTGHAGDFPSQSTHRCSWSQQTLLRHSGLAHVFTKPLMLYTWFSICRYPFYFFPGAILWHLITIAKMNVLCICFLNVCTVNIHMYIIILYIVYIYVEVKHACLR